MAKVLIITSYYPPGTAVGFERVIKFEKYLPQFGFEVVILTTKPDQALPTKAAKHVYQAAEPGNFYRPLVKNLLQKFRKTAVTQQESPSVYRSTQGMFATGSRLSHMRNWLVDQIAIPDMLILWLPNAVRIGRKAIVHEQVDVILSSSPSATVHLVALALAMLTNKPWVADFRDGWLFEPLSIRLRQKSWRRTIEQYLENWVAKKSSAITTISPPITEYFQRAYKTNGLKKTIPNGYDPDDWQMLPPVPQPENRMRIVYTGSFSLSSGIRDPKPFLNAYKLVSDQYRGQLELLLVGSLSEVESNFLTQLELGDSLCLVGAVGKTESLAYQRSADLLLLIVGTDKSVATSKLYEYLYSKRPMIALSGPDTAAAQIIRETESGYIVAPDQVEAIAACLTQLFQLWQQRMLVSQSIHIERFSRQHLAGELANVMKTVMEQKASDGA